MGRGRVDVDIDPLSVSKKSFRHAVRILKLSKKVSKILFD